MIPYILQTAARLVRTPGANVDNVTFDAQGLMNQTHAPIEIGELHFDVKAATWYPVSPLAVLQISGKVGTRFLTQVPTPIAVLGPSRLEERNAALSTAALAGDDSGIFVASLVWKFNQPLVLRPGTGFLFQANTDLVALGYAGGLATNLGAVDVTISAIGRRLTRGASIPARQPVPFVSAGILTATNQTTPILSAEDDFRNATADAVRIRRMVAQRYLYGFNGAARANEWAASAFASSGGSEKVQILFPDRTTLGNAPVPFSAAFDQRGVLEAEFDLPRNARPLLSWSNVAARPLNYAAAGRLVAAVIGDRMEEI